MAELRHRMTRTQANGRQSLFVCTVNGCSRCVVLDHVDGYLLVLDRGQGALHYGTTGPALLTADTESPLPA